MRIHTLRVERKSVGRDFPFDRVYLVAHEDRGYIERLFRAALVLPIDETLRAMLKSITVDAVVERPHERDDEASAPRAPRDEDLAEIIEENGILVVPLLPKWLRDTALPEEVRDQDGKGQQVPRYLVSGKWFEGKKRREEHEAKPFWPSQAYLQTESGKVRPICLACPLMIAHQNGQCTLGQRSCYQALALGVTNYFKAGLDVPEAATTTDGGEDGFVQADDAGIDRAP